MGLPAVNVAVHATGALMFTYSIYFNYVYVNIPKDVVPIDGAWSGKFKYLTFWNAVRNRLRHSFFTGRVIFKRTRVSFKIPNIDILACLIFVFRGF